MACSVKILGVGGQLKGGALDTIKVWGNADNCDKVNITIRCDSATKQETANVTDGAWSLFALVDPREFRCQCDSQIDVIVECIGNDCRDRWTGVLICSEPSNCPEVEHSPDPTIDARLPCDSTGSRSVSGWFTVAPNPGKAVGADLFLDSKKVGSHPATTTPYTIGWSAPLIPGPHKARLELSDGCGIYVHSFTVPPCPGSEDCPKIEIRRIEPGECRGGKRYATVSVLVTPLGGVVSAELWHGTMLDSASAKTAPFVLSGSDTFTSGDTVEVKILQRPECSKSLPIDVERCPGDEGKNGGGTNGGGDDDDGSGGCLVGRIFVVILLATALFLLLVGLCVPGVGTYILVAAAAAAVAGGIAFGLWWLLCGSRCGALLIAWQVSLLCAGVAAFLSTCCPMAIVMAFALGAAAIATFSAWVAKCKPKPCKWVAELLWVFVSGFGLIFPYLTSFVPCGLAAVPLIAAGIGAVLGSALVALKCK